MSATAPGGRSDAVDDTRRRDATLALLLAWASVWHGAQLSTRWESTQRNSAGGDFATYYHAERVASAGGDPYSVDALRADARGQALHPFLYPPPFLLAMAWTHGLDLTTAQAYWFWANELWLLLVGGLLWAWWRGVGVRAEVTAIALAASAGTLHNHTLGQMNLLVMALTLAGLWRAERGRPASAGALVGLAAVLKVAPALFIGWWLIRRQYRAAAFAFITVAAALTLSAALLGADYVAEYVRDVLPPLLTGGAGGTGVDVGAFGNHSLTGLAHAVWPSGGLGASAPARGAATLAGGALLTLGVHATRVRKVPVPQQVALFGVLLVLLPVYAFEHYLVWALPAVVWTLTIALRGQPLCSRRGLWWCALVPAWLIWAIDVADLRRISSALPGLAHAKVASLLVLYAACLWTPTTLCPEDEGGDQEGDEDEVATTERVLA